MKRLPLKAAFLFTRILRSGLENMMKRLEKQHSTNNGKIKKA